MANAVPYNPFMSIHPTSAEQAEWRREFDAAAQRSLRERFRYGFVKTYKPVLDAATYRSFDTTAEYRRWCGENLPVWRGFDR